MKAGLATITELDEMSLEEIEKWGHVLDEFEAAERRAAQKMRNKK